MHETEKIITIPDRSGVQMIDWSEDGQLLAASTTSGSIYIYVTKLQMLFAVFAPRVAILSSLAEISIYIYSPEKVLLRYIFNQTVNIIILHFGIIIYN